MTIQHKLLTYYENCLAELPEGFDEAREYLYSRFIYHGICVCANVVFNETIYQEKWVLSNYEEGEFYWCKQPIRSATTSEIRTALTTRIEILRGIVNGENI